MREKTLQDILNPRQFRLVVFLSKGLTNKQIARRVGTTQGVIKNCFHVIYEVTGAWKRLELAIRFNRERGERLYNFEYLRDAHVPRVANDVSAVTNR